MLPTPPTFLKSDKPVGYNGINGVLFLATLNLRVGMYVVTQSNALRIDREDRRVDLGHSFWTGNLDGSRLEEGQYCIPVVLRYDSALQEHTDALRIIELDTRPTLITHTHCGAEDLMQRTSLERITLDGIHQNVDGNDWIWVNRPSI